MNEDKSKKFHVNPKTGEVSECRAEKRKCKFGEHYSTQEEARVSYEFKMKKREILSLKKIEGNFDSFFYNSEWLKMGLIEKQNAIQNEANRIAKIHGIIPPPPELTFYWEWLEGKNAESYRNRNFIPSKAEKYIRFSYHLVLFEEITCKTIICHELAHLKAWGDKTHGKRWLKVFKIISRDASNVEIKNFFQKTLFTSDDYIRFEIAKIKTNHPKKVWECINRHVIFYFEETQNSEEESHLCPKCALQGKRNILSERSFDKFDLQELVKVEFGKELNDERK